MSLSRDDLLAVLAAPERPRDEFKIGAESEKFGVDRETGAALQYDGEHGVLRVFDWLIRHRGWEPVREREGGPIIALSRAGAGITLEPGGQLELSGAALPDIHQVAAEQGAHLDDIRALSNELGISWLLTGFHPLARQDQLPWVPKLRYAIMREYLPGRGDGALDMMRRTATVQGNFDWSSESDGMAKLVACLKLGPLMHAMLANAPWREGKRNGMLSLRGDVWLRMDPSRSGLIPSLWEKPDPSYDDYVEWALDAGMFLIKRDGEVVANTGQTFRDFLEHGFEAERATVDDWKLHLNTLFPEARLKGTLEVRCFDALPPPLASAALALLTGILYDEGALDRVRAFTEGWRFEDVEGARPGMLREGFRAPFLGRTVADFAEELVEISRSGLERRARRDDHGADESKLLAPLIDLVSQRQTPAEIDLARSESDATYAWSLRDITAV